MWKTKIEEWIASLIPYINVSLSDYNPTEWVPTELSPKFLEDVDGKSELISLLNPQLTYNETTTGYMIKLRTMIDLLELLEKRGVNVEHYVIRRKEIPNVLVYEGDLQVVHLSQQFEPGIVEKLDSISLSEKRHEGPGWIPPAPIYESPYYEKIPDLTDVYLEKAKERELIDWENSLPFKRYVNVLWEGSNEYIVIDNLLIDIRKQRVLAELKNEEERKVWDKLGCDFKPTRRKFSKSIRAKLDETRKSARQDDLQ